MLALGISPYPLELDNYFVARDETPLGEDGQPDFEALGALNLPLLAEHLEQLLAGRRSNCRAIILRPASRNPASMSNCGDGQPIIMEGIHGLDPGLAASRAGRARAFKIYVSALTQLNLDRLNRVSTTDTRLMRRIVRDARERGYSAKDTISRWESVRRGEKK